MFFLAKSQPKRVLAKSIGPREVIIVGIDLQEDIYDHHLKYYLILMCLPSYLFLGSSVLVLNATHAATQFFLVCDRAEQRRHPARVSVLQSGSCLIPQESQPPERSPDVRVDNGKVHVHIIRMWPTTGPVKEG